MRAIFASDFSTFQHELSIRLVATGDLLNDTSLDAQESHKRSQGAGRTEILSLMDAFPPLVQATQSTVPGGAQGSDLFLSGDTCNHFFLLNRFLLKCEPELFPS